ncbi:MAG: aminopeptidase, partial [Candidatus Bathyarchaeota archaeon]
MAEPNINRLADILLDYCFGMVDFGKVWKKDKKRLWLRFKPAADSLAQAITENVFNRGGNVFLEQRPSWWDYTFFTSASEDVLRQCPEDYLYKLKHSAARLVILSDSNTKSLVNVKPERRTAWSKATKPYSDLAMKVDEQGNFLTPWCGTIFPTEAYAQDMEMSLPECREYIYRAMYLDAKDPVMKWQQVARDQKTAIQKMLNKSNEITIVDEADETNLKISVAGHRWIVSDGHVNFPSDELFNAPRKASANGILTIPSLSQYDHGGPEVKGIWLKFKNGKIIKWNADVGKAYLDEFLTKNPGADYLGEFAFGRHPLIDRISKQILLDEKMGGTIHFALGRAYGLHVLGKEDRSGLNQSIRHWDLIRDMRKPSAYIRIGDKLRV